MMKEWNKIIIKLLIVLQNKIHKPDQLLIGWYQSSGSISRNAVFMQSIGLRNFAMKYESQSITTTNFWTIFLWKSSPTTSHVRQLLENLWTVLKILITQLSEALCF